MRFLWVLLILMLSPFAQSSEEADAWAWSANPSDGARIRCHRGDTNPLKCLACNAFFEAANEGTQGIQAVNYVVFNRTSNRQYPKDICKVIYQRKQFSWANKGGKTLSGRNFKKMQFLAIQDMNEFLTGNMEKSAGACSTHYVNLGFRWARRNSGWRRKMSRQGQIKHHTFFKDRGHKCANKGGKGREHLARETSKREGRSGVNTAANTSAYTFGKQQ